MGGFWFISASESRRNKKQAHPEASAFINISYYVFYAICDIRDSQHP